MLEYEYIWLDLVGDIPIEAIAKLKAIYTSEYRIYLATFCPSNFRKVLIINNILIPKSTFLNMINLKFKEESLKISQMLQKEKIEVVGILQKEYPRSLRSLEKCPTAIYLKASKQGNEIEISTFKNRFINMYKLFMLEGKNEFNKEILDYIWPKTIYKKQKRYLTSNTFVFDSVDVKKIKAGDVEYTGICKVGEIDVYVLKRKNIYIDSNKITLAIIDGIVIARVSNIEKGIDIVDYVLEGGRDIFAVPGNILYRENYLANHVIKQGAYIVTNRYDMKNLV